MIYEAVLLQSFAFKVYPERIERSRLKVTLPSMFEQKLVNSDGTSDSVE